MFDVLAEASMPFSLVLQGGRRLLVTLNELLAAHRAQRRVSAVLVEHRQRQFGGELEGAHVADGVFHRRNKQMGPGRSAVVGRREDQLTPPGDKPST